MNAVKPFDNQEGSKNAHNIALPKNGPFFQYVVVGAKGRGKSTIVLGLLNDHFKRYYDNIYFFSTSAHLDDKYSELIKELQTENKYFDKFSEKSIALILDAMENYNDDNPQARNLIIFDDMISQLPRATDRDSLFNKLIVGNRHRRCDLWLTTQQFRKLNTLVRANIDIISLFPTSNLKELKAYSEELNVNKKEFEEYLCMIENDRHDFLTVNFMNGKPIFFKNFSLLN